MANEHPKLEDNVPQFSGKISETFVELVTYVKLCEAEHKEETKPRLGPRLYRRGLLEADHQHIGWSGRRCELLSGPHHRNAQK